VTELEGAACATMAIRDGLLFAQAGPIYGPRDTGFIRAQSAPVRGWASETAKAAA